VLLPSFIINRIVVLFASLQFEDLLPGFLELSWEPTVLGLVSIPLIILPLDILAHFLMNSSFRRASSSILS